MNQKIPTRVAEFPNYRVIYPIANNQEIIEPPPYTREEIVLSDSSDVEIVQESTNENVIFNKNLLLKKVPKPKIIYASKIFPMNDVQKSSTSEELIIPNSLDFVDVGTLENNNNNNVQENSKNKTKLIVRPPNEQIKINQESNNIANQIIKAIENQNLIMNKGTIIVDHSGINNNLLQRNSKSKVELITKCNKNLNLFKEVPNKKLKISIIKNGKIIKCNIPSLTIHEVPITANSIDTLIMEKNNKTLNAIISYCGICDKTCEMHLSITRCQICKTKLQYQCRKCSRKYMTWSKIISHINIPCPPQNSIPKAKIYKCKYCSFTSVCHANVKEHIITEHTKQKVYCQRCRKSFVDNITGREFAKVHMMNCTIGFLKCKFCPHKLEYKRDLKKHIEFFHKNEFKPQDLEDIIAGEIMKK